MRKSNGDKKRKNHSHKGHMWMMALCCGLPIVGFLAIAVLGISMPSLETLLLLICPIGMIGMMYLMHRDRCANNSQDAKDNTKGNVVDLESKREQSTTVKTNTGKFEA